MIKSNIKCERVSLNSGNTEYTCAEFRADGSSVHVMALYHSPTTEMVLAHFDPIAALTISGNVFIGADMKAMRTDWVNAMINTNGTKLVSFLHSYPEVSVKSTDGPHTRAEQVHTLTF